MGDAFVIHPGALGDVLLAVPALRVLRASGELTIAAQPRIGALLVALGVADRAVAFETLGLDALFSDAPLAAHAPFVRHVEGARQVVCWFGARDQDFVRRFRGLAPDAVIAPPHTRAEPVWRHLLHTVGAGDDTAGGDLRDPVTPGTELVYFFLFKLFGPRAWIHGAVVAALGLALTWLCLMISRKVIAGWKAFLPSLLFLGLQFRLGLGGRHHWFSELLVMAAVAVILERRSAARLAAAGALCGLASSSSALAKPWPAYSAQSFSLWPRMLMLWRSSSVRENWQPRSFFRFARVSLRR